MKNAFDNMARRVSPQLRLWLVGIVLVGMAAGMFETVFNNYLSDTFAISADTRGYIEFPRELPGFLTALFAGALFFLPETLIAGFCGLAIGLGMLGLAVWGANWNLMIGLMVLWSIGTHLLMPVRSSVSMHLADGERRGRRLGQVQGTGLAAMVLGCGAVWIGMQYLHVSYAAIFALGGAAALVSSIAFFAMRLPEAHLKRPKFVWNRRYWLFYVLAGLFGARKQVFLTFAPWVLVRVFHQPAHVIARLWMAAAVLGVVAQPVLGNLIDRFGERRVLIADSILVFLVCAGYGFSYRVPGQHAALWLLYACYIGDHLLFGVNIARTTYLSKIAPKSDLAPTLSLGVSINHAVSMAVPALGGLLWVRFGYPSVFAAAACVAVLMFVFALRIPD